jgi:pimeloyl-ACP methyl ester carboxylesterase
MLSFLLPARRRAKVEWLMDQYAEAKALYPEAEFSFVGHSNGTYLLADALKRYPSCRFKHVVFAGSVVSTNYPWPDFLNRGSGEEGHHPQVKAILNYVATHDWVVAFFPKALQMLPKALQKILRQDLGSGGHDGFAKLPQPSRQQVEYVYGGHSAALNEKNWDEMPALETISKRQNCLIIAVS